MLSYRIDLPVQRNLVVLDIEPNSTKIMWFRWDDSVFLFSKQGHFEILDVPARFIDCYTSYNMGKLEELQVIHKQCILI